MLSRRKFLQVVGLSAVAGKVGADAPVLWEVDKNKAPLDVVSVDAASDGAISQHVWVGDFGEYAVSEEWAKDAERGIRLADFQDDSDCTIFDFVVRGRSRRIEIPGKTSQHRGEQVYRLVKAARQAKGGDIRPSEADKLGLDAKRLGY